MKISHLPGFLACCTRFARVGLAASLALAFFVHQAVACCDDFLSCAAAVATAGLSCAAEAALDALQGTLQGVQSHRDLAVNLTNAEIKEQEDALQQALATIDRALTAAVREIETDSAEAAKLAGPWASGGATVVRRGATAETAFPKGPSPSNGIAGASTVEGLKPASGLPVASAPADDHSLAAIKALIDRLDVQKVALMNELRQDEAEAKAEAVAQTNGVNGALNVSVLKPLDQLIASLKACLSNPLAAGDLISASLQLLDDAMKGLDVEVKAALGQSSVALTTAAQKPQAALNTLVGVAAQSKKLIASMRVLAAMSSTVERTKYFGGLDLAPKPVPPAPKLRVLAWKPSAAMLAISTTLPKKTTALKASLRQLSVKHPPMNVAPFRPKQASDLDGYFKGKSAAEGKLQRDKLIAEAKTRYAKDPATLKALVAYLDKEASARGVH
jgi:hypothetical protein